jgi:hypothetical protein
MGAQPASTSPGRQAGRSEQVSRQPIESYGRTHNSEPGIRCWCHKTHNPLPAPQPVAVEELAALNPELDEGGLARLQALEQLLAEDDQACGYQDPEEN